MTASNRPSVLVRMGRLRPGTVLPASYPDGSSEAPFEGSPGALAVKDRRGRAGLPGPPAPIRHRSDRSGSAGRVDPLPLDAPASTYDTPLRPRCRTRDHNRFQKRNFFPDGLYALTLS